MPDLLFGVDRFIVMEGVVICDGWCSGMTAPDAQAELLFDGAPLPGQQLVAVYRPDLIEVMRRAVPERLEPDGEAPSRWGFCIRALLPLPPSQGGECVNLWGGEDDDCYLRLSLRLRADGAEELLEDPAKTHLRAGNAEHRALSKRFRQAILESTAPRILEIGSRGSSLARMMGKRNVPPADAIYIGLDYHPGEGVNLVGDAHRLSKLIPEPVDFVFSAATFEHLLMPWKAAVEIARVLRVGGTLQPPHRLRIARRHPRRSYRHDAVAANKIPGASQGAIQRSELSHHRLPCAQNLGTRTGLAPRAGRPRVHGLSAIAAVERTKWKRSSNPSK